VSLLETVAGKLGMVEWGSGGAFQGINVNMPGEIVSVQADIQSLTNDIGTANNDSTGAAATAQDNTQLIELLQEQNLQLSETLALNEAQTSVLAGMIPQIPHYAQGGPVIGDQLAQLHDQEYVVPRGGALVSGGSGPAPAAVHVHNHIHGDAQGLIRTIRSEIHNPVNVLGVSKQIGRRTSMLSSRPGQRRTDRI